MTKARLNEKQPSETQNKFAVNIELLISKSPRNHSPLISSPLISSRNHSTPLFLGTPISLPSCPSTTFWLLLFFSFFFLFRSLLLLLFLRGQERKRTRRTLKKKKKIETEYETRDWKILLPLHFMFYFCFSQCFFDSAFHSAWNLFVEFCGVLFSSASCARAAMLSIERSTEARCIHEPLRGRWSNLFSGCSSRNVSIPAPTETTFPLLSKGESMTVSTVFTLITGAPAAGAASLLASGMGSARCGVAAFDAIFFETEEFESSGLLGLCVLSLSFSVSSR